MAKFNLLPWRQEARERQKKSFYTAVGFGVALAAVLVFLAHLYVQGLIEFQHKRNQFLNNEIKLLDKKIASIKKIEATRQALLDRIKVIENLQSTRPSIVHLFDEIASAIPKGIYLTRLHQKGLKVNVSGKSESNARVSSYMNRLNASDWLDSSNLRIIEVEDKHKQQGVTRLRNFRLDVTQVLKPRKKKKVDRKGGR